jgi:hypothetical protein
LFSLEGHVRSKGERVPKGKGILGEKLPFAVFQHYLFFISICSLGRQGNEVTIWLFQHHLLQRISFLSEYSWFLG